MKKIFTCLLLLFLMFVVFLVSPKTYAYETNGFEGHKIVGFTIESGGGSDIETFYFTTKEGYSLKQAYSDVSSSMQMYFDGPDIEGNGYRINTAYGTYYIDDFGIDLPYLTLEDFDHSYDMMTITFISYGKGEKITDKIKPGDVLSGFDLTDASTNYAYDGKSLIKFTDGTYLTMSLDKHSAVLITDEFNTSGKLPLEYSYCDSFEEPKVVAEVYSIDDGSRYNNLYTVIDHIDLYENVDPFFNSSAFLYLPELMDPYFYEEEFRLSLFSYLKDGFIYTVSLTTFQKKYMLVVSDDQGLLYNEPMGYDNVYSYDVIPLSSILNNISDITLINTSNCVIGTKEYYYSSQATLGKLDNGEKQMYSYGDFSGMQFHFYYDLVNAYSIEEIYLSCRFTPVSKVSKTNLLASSNSYVSLLTTSPD